MGDKKQDQASNIQEFPVVTTQQAEKNGFTGSSSAPSATGYPSGVYEVAYIAPQYPTGVYEAGYIPPQYRDDGATTGSGAATSTQENLVRLVTPAANGIMASGGFALPGITSTASGMGAVESTSMTIMGEDGSVIAADTPPVADPVKGTTFNAKKTFLAVAIILIEQLLFDLAMKPSQQAQAGAQLDAFGQQIQQLITEIQNVVNKIPQQALQSPAGQQFLQNMQQLLAGLKAIAAAHSQAGQVMQTSAQQTSSNQTATAIKTTAIDLVVGMLMNSLFGFWAAIGVAAGMLAFMKLMSQKTDSSLNQMSSTVNGIQTQTTDATLAAMQTALGQLQQGAAQLQSIAAGANGSSTNPFLQSQTGVSDPYSAMNPTVGQLPPGVGTGGNYGGYGNGTGWNDITPPGMGSGSATGAGGGSSDDLSNKVVIDLDPETGKVKHVETPKGDYDIDINGQKIHIDDGSVSA